MMITATGVSTTGSPRLLEAVEVEGGWQLTILGNNNKRHAVITLSSKDSKEVGYYLQSEGKRK